MDLPVGASYEQGVLSCHQTSYFSMFLTHAIGEERGALLTATTSSAHHLPISLVH